MQMVDRTGMPSTEADYDEAIAAVTDALVRSIAALPPMLAVQLPNVIRCLKQGKSLTAIAERARAAQGKGPADG